MGGAEIDCFGGKKMPAHGGADAPEKPASGEHHASSTSGFGCEQRMVLGMAPNEYRDVRTGWNDLQVFGAGVIECAPDQFLGNAATAEFGRDKRVGENHPTIFENVFRHRELAGKLDLIAMSFYVVVDDVFAPASGAVR
jgi:hypothetical protein